MDNLPGSISPGAWKASAAAAPNWNRPAKHAYWQRRHSSARRYARMTTTSDMNQPVHPRARLPSTFGVRLYSCRPAAATAALSPVPLLRPLCSRACRPEASAVPRLHVPLVPRSCATCQTQLWATGALRQEAHLERSLFILPASLMARSMNFRGASDSRSSTTRSSTDRFFKCPAACHIHTGGTRYT